MAISKLSEVNPSRGTVTVDGDWVDASLRFNDQSGAAYLRSRPTDEARVEAMEVASKIGLRSLALAGEGHTEQLLDQKLDEMVTDLNRAAEDSLKKASEAFSEKWRKNIDEELTAKLDGHRRAVDEKLSSLFGDGSDRSVQKTIQKLITDYEVKVVRELAEDRDRLRKEMTSLINGANDPNHPIAKIDGKVTELRKEVSAALEAARAAAVANDRYQKTAAAGFDFQSQAYGAIVEMFKGTDNVDELLGRVPGATGGADGDVVIHVDPRLTNGTPVKVAVEITKQANGLTQSKNRATLKKAMADRGAQTAVLVIRDAAVLGGQRLEFHPGLGAIAVYNPDDPEEFRSLAMLIAIKHAIAIAVREARPVAPTLDPQRIEKAGQKAKEALGAVEVVLGNQTKIIKLADSTCGTAKDLRRVVLDALDEINAALN